MRLQARDKRLLECLYRFGALTTSQVKRTCFDGIAHTTVLRRLRKLEGSGLILRLSGLEYGTLAWTLTNRGAEQVGIDRPTEYRNKNTLRHTTLLADVRLTLESIGLGKTWTSEMEIRRENFDPRQDSTGAIIPDGLFMAEVMCKPQMVTLELELSPKTRARYNELFAIYARKDAIGTIWYIVDSMPLGESLLRIWKSVRKLSDSPKLYISKLSEILENPLQAKLFGCDEETSIQKIFGFNMPSRPAHTGAQGVSKKTKLTLSTQDNSTSNEISAT